MDPETEEDLKRLDHQIYISQLHPDWALERVFKDILDRFTNLYKKAGMDLPDFLTSCTLHKDSKGNAYVKYKDRSVDAKFFWKHLDEIKTELYTPKTREDIDSQVSHSVKRLEHAIHVPRKIVNTEKYFRFLFMLYIDALTLILKYKDEDDEIKGLLEIFRQCEKAKLEEEDIQSLFCIVKDRQGNEIKVNQEFLEKAKEPLVEKYVKRP